MTPRPVGWRLLILSVAAISLATLVPTGGSTSSPDFCILCGHRGLSDFLSNIIMFAPFGFALARRGFALRRAALLGLLFTLSIEVAQLDLISGRDANIGDVLANSFGTILGWLVACHRAWWAPRDGGPGRRRALIATSATLAILLIGLALFSPSLPATTWHMQWTARFGNMASYEGRVLSTRIGPLDVPGRQAIQKSDSVRRMLFEQPLEVIATGAVPRGIAPIVSIYDEDQREILMLAADRADLVYRYRMLADVLRLDRGDLRVHQAFEHIAEGSTYRLVWSVDRKGYCLDREGRLECGRGFTVGDTWTLLMALDWGTAERDVLRAMWLWLVFLPTGLLLGRGRTPMLAAALVVVVLVAGPLALGFAATPLYQLFASLIGLASGWVLSWRRMPAHTPSSSSS